MIQSIYRRFPGTVEGGDYRFPVGIHELNEKTGAWEGVGPLSRCQRHPLMGADTRYSHVVKQCGLEDRSSY